MMAWVGVIVGLALIVVIFVDTFEALILPRRVAHSFRLGRAYYQLAWRIWRSVASRLPAGRRRFGFLSVFGPLSLFGLLIVWAVALIAGFALLHWSLETAITGNSTDFLTY